MKESFKELAEYIQGKNVLCIPIISSIDRLTGKYKLDADGNVNRVITTFWHANTFNKLYLVLPKNHVEGSEVFLNKWIELKKENKIEIIWAESFGVHAGEQRSNYFVVNNLKNELATYFHGNEIDVYMMESQGLVDSVFPSIVSNIKKSIVYWCPVCSVKNRERSFTKGYEEVNKRLFLLADKTILVSPEQVEYFSQDVEGTDMDKLIYLPQLIDRDIPVFDYTKDVELDEKLKRESYWTKYYYLPYRLTDEGYKIDSVIDYINKCTASHKVVIYSDPNNSGYMNSLEDKFEHHVSFMKVSTSRDICYTILDSEVGVEVPYLECLSFINHGMIWELMSEKSNCKFGILKTQYDKNPYDVNSCSRCFYIDITKL